MNPLIFYSKLQNGVVEIPLGHQCKCYVGLVSITLPNIIRDDIDDQFQDINISCDQIDSTMANRKRLLRRICVEKNKNFYTTHEFKNILYFPVDSSDEKLTIRIRDSYGQVEVPERVGRKQNASQVTIILNILPKDVARDQWIKRI